MFQSMAFRPEFFVLVDLQDFFSVLGLGEGGRGVGGGGGGGGGVEKKEALKMTLTGLFRAFLLKYLQNKQLN